jgi:hypothetical protein
MEPDTKSRKQPHAKYNREDFSHMLLSDIWLFLQPQANGGAKRSCCLPGPS